ncbi:expressed protein [Batrachochytrium dendrobatidis JAM81]|uniref:Expressed protein n=1 Tax=Batrachochytrium dendrobatidis (strain JAM81 / FGSC 10211) TaxID=684364 RepID=F4NTI2_BATDJ|nr:uncharacterized protein BATDEDRAFT_36394 [Batrachochytrium dendrobatidis JAM81]EGF83927.1 expressed protein [Batrachochytrium dendrobatidis JAM81]|eukprot:XP_006675848.1 expressed protein [Batrachochytrium dendrobatidis JAM81]
MDKWLERLVRVTDVSLGLGAEAVFLGPLVAMVRLGELTLKHLSIIFFGAIVIRSFLIVKSSPIRVVPTESVIQPLAEASPLILGSRGFPSVEVIVLFVLACKPILRSAVLSRESDVCRRSLPKILATRASLGIKATLMLASIST